MMLYGFKVKLMEVENHRFWAAESTELNGCVGQGDTMEEALQELAANEQEWIETAKEVGIPIPALVPETPSPYSGKFVVRVAPYIHQVAAECAKKQGISLNQYVNNAILAANTAKTFADVFAGEVKNLKQAADKVSVIVYPKEECCVANKNQIKDCSYRFAVS